MNEDKRRMENGADRSGEVEKTDEERQGRRNFLKKAATAAAAAGLTHFMLVGGTRRAWASPADCPNWNTDHCDTPSNPTYDACDLFHADTCYDDGRDAGDTCMKPVSEDKCSEPNSGAGYDVCDLSDNDDVCCTSGDSANDNPLF